MGEWDVDLLAQKIRDTDPILLDEWEQFDAIEGLGQSRLLWIVANGFKVVCQFMAGKRFDFSLFDPWYVPPKTDGDSKAMKKHLKKGLKNGQRSGR